MESPFEVLQIRPDADEREIERAHRRRVLETHPDQGGSMREFQAVRAAYEELTPGDRRESTDGPGSVEESGSADEPSEPSGVRVEYLDYEVLDDHGWDLEDDDLFEKASAAGLGPPKRGRILVQPHEFLLEAAENRGFRWPYACRGGACANCAVAVAEGELSMPADHILPSEMLESGIRLSCNAVPVTEEAKIVFNLKHRPGLDELRLPPHRFERAHLTD